MRFNCSMRGQTSGLGTVDMIVRAVLEEFPGLDKERLRVAIERGQARAASAALNTEGRRIIDLHLSRVEATEEATERARILRELSESLEEHGDADRAVAVRLAAFGEAGIPDDIDPLLRLAKITDRWTELPLEAMTPLVKINDEAPRRLTEIALAWQKLGRGYDAADCLERVLAIDPLNQRAHDELELFYRSTAEWPSLIELLNRRALNVDDVAERAELYREMGVVYDQYLADDGGALDAYREADKLDPDRPEVLAAIARLGAKVGMPDEEALESLQRLAGTIADPIERARVLTRAGEVAKLHDWNLAGQLYERARSDDPDHVPAIDGFVALLRDRGDLGAAIDVLEKAAARPALAAERSRWLTYAADFCVAQGETERAKALYREARISDPTNHEAGLALVELCSDTGSLAELAPILDELCRTTEDPARLRTYLLQRSKVAAELGDRTGARVALSRAIEIDPAEQGPRQELANMLFDAQQYAKARPLLEGLLEDEDMLPQDVAVELHYRVARCAMELGERDTADKHVSIVLALVPDHRGSLMLRSELDTNDPFAHAASQLALANIAPREEKAQRFAALGDRYVELGDPMTAREMYREALAHRPGDHLLLTKFLHLVAEEGDWSYALDLVQRLIDTENDPKVRARYRHTAAMIARDELTDNDLAMSIYEQALEDDPMSFAVADEYEALLSSLNDLDELVRFYYRRLEHVRITEGREGERLRLWDRLASLCMALDRHDDAQAAYEVALTLAPESERLTRHVRLAELYLQRGNFAPAIAQHQAILRHDKRRIASYEALRVLYTRTKQHEKALACADALTVFGEHPIKDRILALFGPGANVEPTRPSRTLTNEDWMALSRLDVDLQLSALFALVAPAFAADRARMRPPQGMPAREQDVPPTIAKVLAQVVKVFGLTSPPVYLDREQHAPAALTMRQKGGVLVPVLVIGRPALDDQVGDNELAFVIARQLADLRNDRIARLLCPRPGELAQIIEIATSKGDATTHSAKWLTSSLHPVELDQATALGARLRERGIVPLRAALDWTAATERAGDRIGFVVVGDLPTCVRVLERDQQTDRVTELVWSSVTEEVLAVRSRVEGWDRKDERKSSAQLAAVESR